MNEAIYKQPLILFLGAGASVSLGKYTTEQFFEWLRLKSFEPKSKLAMVPQIAEAVRKRSKANVKASDEIDRKVDVEAILDVVEEIVGSAELEDMIRKEMKISVPSIRPYLADLVPLRDQIKDLVVSHYSEIEQQKAFVLYSPLIESVLLNPLPIFTTNYDLAWEKTYELTSDPSYDLREAPFTLIDGFRRQRVATPQWLRSEYDDYEPTGADVILFKLHGSVDWVRTPSRAIQRVESGQRNPGGMPTVIAYPSRLKREIHEEPFRTNYDYLLACLLHAKVCAVIGFSFRDQEIVEELRQAMGLNKDLELVIIDPNADTIKTHLQNRLGFEPQVELIKEEFTVESAPSIAYKIKAKVDKALKVKQKKPRERRPPPPPATEEPQQRIAVALERIAEHLDGLPEAPPKIRDPFLEGRKLQREYKYQEAIQQYQACLQPETTPSQRAALHILIGNCFLGLSELEEAEGHYREAETAAREAGDKEGLAAALGNIGLIYHTRGELDKALDYHQQSLKIHREIGQKEGEASALGNIGIVHGIKRELDKALDFFQQALKINRDIGRKEGEASDLGNIGLIYQHKGELDKALEYHQQSLKIEREIGRKEGQASDLGNIGSIYSYKGEPAKALEHLEQALKIFEEIGAKIEVEKAKQNIQKIMKSMEKTRGQDRGNV